MPASGHTGRIVLKLSVGSSDRSSVSKIVNTNEPILMPNGANGPRNKGIKGSISRVTRLKAKVKITRGQS